MRIKLMISVIVLLLDGPCIAQKEQGKTKVNNNGVTYLVKKDALFLAPPGGVKIGGYLGNKLDLCIDNRVMAQDQKRIVDPLIVKNDGASHGWRGMFWENG